MTDKTATDRSDNEGRSTFGLYLACGSLMFMILSLDLLIPLGVAMGVPYIMVVLISLWSPHKRFTVLVAITCSVFTIGAVFYQPAVAEMWKVIFNRALALFAIWVTASLGLQRKTVEQNREKTFREREKALENVRILHGLIPICASCKMIRDDEGYWTQIEAYIKDHSEADFSHGLCPECAKRLYPGFYERENS